MPNSEFSLNIKDQFYRITLDRSKEECIVPGNVITSHIKIQKVNYMPTYSGKGLIESIVEDCLKTLLEKGGPVPYVYFASKKIAVTEYEVQLFIDAYDVSV